MKTLNQDEFKEILDKAPVKARLKSELKFVSSTSKIKDVWDDCELIAISDRTGNKGVLLMQPEDKLFITQYELSNRIIDSGTGRDRSIICDLCYTWQRGSKAASITFRQPGSKNSVSWLCCGDLNCSQHVRTQTSAGVVSRSQLREDLTNEDRVARLKNILQDKIKQLGLQPIKMD
jgi:hypothetical protein